MERKNENIFSRKKAQNAQMNSGKNKLRRHESQRDSIIQTRVARHELPWVCRTTEYNPEGGESMRAHRRCNPVGVENNFGRLPRVARCAANPGLNDSIPLGWKPHPHREWSGENCESQGCHH
jgi:hypothetical protein